MIITYLRSSSAGSFEWCKHKYFLTYCLGFKDNSNKKAVKGNIVHKALELLANKQLSLQTNSKVFLDDELEKSFDTLLICPEESIKSAFDFYSNKETDFEWTKKDYEECTKWMWDTLLFSDGMFSPLERRIVEPEKYFDIEVDKPWAKYDFRLMNGETVSGNLRLKGTMDLITRIDSKTIEYIDWKGLAVDTPIPTETGWSTMGELEIGDIIFDKDGNKTKVLAKSSKSYKTCYKIVFDDKSDVVCDNDHLWLLNTEEVKKITELKVGDCIDLAKPMNTGDQDLPIDPYVFGVWLGDGRNRSCEITSADSFTFEEITKRGCLVGENIAKKDKKAQSKTIFGLTKTLKAMNVLNNKHIPIQYLRASYAQRLDLLRGLMDTDGNINKGRKQCVFTSCNKKLSDDVKELLLSLGQRVNQSYVLRDTNFKKNVSVFPLVFRAIGINPFLLPRKANSLGDWGVGQSNKRKIISIDLLSTQLETQCISVDSPSKTYLCTKNMIPTHNTGERKNWSTGKEKGYDDLFNDFQLRLYHYALSKVYPNEENIIITVFFVRSGGPFTICFHKEDLEKTEEMIRDKFESIKKCKIPARIIDLKKDKWKCERLCKFYKDDFENTGVSTCQKIHEEILELGLEKVYAKYADFSAVKQYGSGGGKTNRE